MASVNSPTVSILKKLPNDRRNFPHQVRFDETKLQLGQLDVPAILKEYIDGRSEDGYHHLLLFTEDANYNDARLLYFLQQANKSISLLSPKVESFVEALLNVKWIDKSPEVIQEYAGFLHTLVSAHNYYCKGVLRMLVSHFTLGPEANIALSYIHEILKGIMDIIPLSRPIVLEYLGDGFPIMSRENKEHVNFVRNLLQFTEYYPMATSYVLNLIIARLIKLDAKAPREDLLKVTYTKEDDEVSIVACAAKLLDELMIVILDHCAKKCTSTWTVHRNFFNDLYSSFVSLILSTIGVHHTHFLMLYVCSTKPALYEAFIERLWTLFQTPSSPLPLRKSAADYLASFLGKAKFLPMKIVVDYLKIVCQWIHAYIERQSKGEGAAAFKIRAHSAFYAACHIPFYVVAARHGDFLENKKHLTSLQAMDLTRIVSCNLNPLRYCHTTTVLQFAESATHLQVVYCHTIIKRDQRRCLPETDTNCLMDTEYPFEKYLLQGSSHIINPLIIDKPIGREDSLYDSDQVMEELLSESPRVGGLMHHFLG